MADRMSFFHLDSLSCEPILRTAPNGELICVSQCGDVTEPAPENRVYVFHSKDDGESWSAPQLIWPEDGQAVYLTEVMVLGDEITVFLTLHNGSFLNWRCMMIKSRDSGYTWQQAGPPPFFPTFTFMRGMIQLQNGDILIPYQHYPITEEENQRLLAQGLKWKDSNIDRVENGVIKSKDGGKTWTHHQGASIPMKGDTGRNWVWSEPTIAELPDGHIGMLLRVCGSGKLWESYSCDGGETWSEAMPTQIPNPGNKPKLISIPGGRIALIHTPSAGRGLLARTPLAIWISDDGMKTWTYREVVSDFPGSFCYPDGFYRDGHLLFTIEFNRHDILFIDHGIKES